jgi:hypothetical protein
LKDILNLNATAAKICRFLEVPISVVKEVQKDSPFAEVLALNAAARRAGGQYIGRIDQDTLVGRRFLQTFFEWTDGKENPGFDLKTSYLFSKRRQIPFQFSKNNLPLKYVKIFLDLCGKRLWIESHPPFFFNSAVGIMILGKDLWMKCGGYDERLIYWGWMEVDIAFRLARQHELVDIGPKVQHDFYHLEHYDPNLPRITPRKQNPTNSENLEFHPNGENWGMIEYSLSLSQGSVSCSDKAVKMQSDPSSAWRNWNIVLRNAFELFYNRFKCSMAGRVFYAVAQPRKYLFYLNKIRQYVASRVISPP